MSNITAETDLFSWVLRQFADQNSPRTILIAGFGLYMSLSIPDYFTTYAAANPGTAGPINTSNQDFNSAPRPVMQCPPHSLSGLSCSHHMSGGRHEGLK